jgi:hypothetical protein
MGDMVLTVSSLSRVVLDFSTVFVMKSSIVDTDEEGGMGARFGGRRPNVRTRHVTIDLPHIKSGT